MRKEKGESPLEWIFFAAVIIIFAIVGLQLLSEMVHTVGQKALPADSSMRVAPTIRNVAKEGRAARYRVLEADQDRTKTQVLEGGSYKYRKV